MVTFAHIRNRLLSEYPSSLITVYLTMGAGIVAQVILVPLYLATLGKEGFGAFTLIAGLITYAVTGVAWLNGALQRVLGEAAGIRDRVTFVRALDAGKLLVVSYAIVAALLGIGLQMTIGSSHVSLAAAVLAGVFLVASYEAGVERLAMTSVGRQPATNLLQTLQVLVYLGSVAGVLHLGGGLPGVFACQLASVLVSRALIPLCWRGKRPYAPHTLADLKPLVARLTGRMARGYFVTGLLAVSSQSDVLVVGWLGGPAAAAQFVLVWKIAEVGVQVLSRLPEQLTPLLVRLDATGQHAAIRQRYGRVARLMLAAAIPGSIAYAVLGPWITRLWLGADHAPHDPLGFILAGAAILWLGLARLPLMLTYSLARTRLWNALAFVEIAARWTLTAVLFPRYGYLSPLVALNVVHLCGIAVALQWAGRRLLVRSP